MSDEDRYYFDGFDSPNYTQVPDAVFDVLMPILSGAEFKVLLYIIRRTFGFKKREDEIALQQIISGIKTRDGRQLDGGTGLSRDSVTKAIKSLEEKGVITRNRRYSEERGDQPSTYSLRFKGESGKSASPESENLTPPHGEIGPPPVRESDSQETVEQQTEQQERDLSNDSNDPLIMSREDAERIAWYVKDLAREFNDQAPLKSTATRVCRLYSQSGLELDAFLDLLQASRVRTQRYSGNIKTTAGGDGRKPKMAYMLSVLENFITEDKTGSSESRSA